MTAGALSHDCYQDFLSESTFDHASKSMQREDPLLTLERTCALPFFKNPCGIFANYVSELTLFLKPKSKIYSACGCADSCNHGHGVAAAK